MAEHKSVGTLDAYLKKHNVTRYQLGKMTGVRASVWQTLNDRPFRKWKIEQLQILANAFDDDPSETLKELAYIENNIIERNNEIR